MDAHFTSVLRPLGMHARKLTYVAVLITRYILNIQWGIKFQCSKKEKSRIFL
jgi:hypothetical protein